MRKFKVGKSQPSVIELWWGINIGKKERIEKENKDYTRTEGIISMKLSSEAIKVN